MSKTVVSDLKCRCGDQESYIEHPKVSHCLHWQCQCRARTGEMKIFETYGSSTDDQISPDWKFVICGLSPYNRIILTVYGYLFKYLFKPSILYDIARASSILLGEAGDALTLTYCNLTSWTSWNSKMRLLPLIPKVEPSSYKVIIPVARSFPSTSLFPVRLHLHFGDSIFRFIIQYGGLAISRRDRSRWRCVLSWKIKFKKDMDYLTRTPKQRRFQSSCMHFWDCTCMPCFYIWLCGWWQWIPQLGVCDLARLWLAVYLGCENVSVAFGEFLSGFAWLNLLIYIGRLSILLVGIPCSSHWSECKSIERGTNTRLVSLMPPQCRRSQCDDGSELSSAVHV